MTRKNDKTILALSGQYGSHANISVSLHWIDISVTLRNEMVHWPDDPPVHIKHVKDMERGDNANLSLISMGAHSGTHMDAPLHFIREGIGIDKMPLDTAVGHSRVIEIHDTESIKPEELVRHRIRRGERILFKTRNSSRVWQRDTFVEDFIFISTEAAQFLVDVVLESLVLITFPLEVSSVRVVRRTGFCLKAVSGLSRDLIYHGLVPEIITSSACHSSWNKEMVRLPVPS